MPLIDNFLLSNKGIDGPVKGGVYLSQEPNLPITTYNVNNTPSSSWTATVANIPAGTKLISIMATGANAASAAIGVLNIQNNQNYGGVGLRDSNGVVFPIFIAGNAGNLYLLDAQIDLVTKNCLVRHNSGGTTAAAVLALVLPTNFDVSGLISIGLVSLANSGASMGTFQGYCTNMRVVSL